MNARTLRRAAERKARKQARKANEGMEKDIERSGRVQQTCHLPETAFCPAFPRKEREEERQEAPSPSHGTMAASPARLAANRKNAQGSTGPKTHAGKERSKLNAVQTGLTGRTVLLQTDDADRYREHVDAWTREYNPVGPRECILVQSIADSYWRTERIVRLEFALFAQGAPALAAENNVGNTAPEDLLREQSGTELNALLHFEKQLRNLHIQEARLNRQREKDKKELATLQKERVESERHQREQAAIDVQTAVGRRRNTSSAPADDGGTAEGRAEAVGFEFSSGPETTDSAFLPARQSARNEIENTWKAPAAA